MVLAGHLGLLDYASSVLSKVVGCSKCMTFWMVVVILLCQEHNPVITVTLAMLYAYVSLWFELLLGALNQLYDWIWEKIIKRPKRPQRR